MNIPKAGLLFPV